MKRRLPFDQEGLPDYWGIETRLRRWPMRCAQPHQEGLPDYWGIETCSRRGYGTSNDPDQEGLPDYWGIETHMQPATADPLHRRSGRITRLLGY